MMRSLLLLLLGAGAGAVGTYTLVLELDDRHGQPTGQGGAGALADPWAAAGAPGPLAAAAGPPSIAEGLTVYASAARADAAALQALLAEAAAEPASAAQRFTLGVLLARYAEIDPGRAVRYARELRLDAALRAPLYQALAASDARAALDALREIRSPSEAHTAGIAVLRALGVDPQSAARVLAALPQVDKAAFLADAVTLRAETDPAAALAQALALDGASARALAVQRIAAGWARRDPRGALGEAAAIRDPAMRAAFQSAVLREWALFEPDGMVAYVGTLDPATQSQVIFAGALPALMQAQADPRRMLEIAEGMSGPAALAFQQLALQRLAQRDPLAAVARLEKMPIGSERQQLLQSIATAYGERAPEEALAWARSLQPPQAGVLGAVLGGIAEVDVDRALDLAIAETSPRERLQALQSIILRSAARDPFGEGGQARRVANRLLEQSDGVARRQSLQMLISMWAGTDPAGALDWLLANDGAVGDDAYRQLAQQFGQRDPTAAAVYTYQVPEAVRDEWIVHVAQGYARVDSPAAVGWIEQFRDHPVYPAAVTAVAPQVAQHDPRSAARLLEGIDATSGSDRGAFSIVASQWAQQDPAAAANWALGLEDAQLRASALAGAAQQWASVDATWARSWALSLPRGEVRDAALGAIVAVIASSETPDRSLLDAFSGDAERQQAVQAAVFALARRDVEEARRFIDTHVTDPRQRAQAEQMLESARQNSVNVARGVRIGPSLVPSSVIVPVLPPMRSESPPERPR